MLKKDVKARYNHAPHAGLVMREYAALLGTPAGTSRCRVPGKATKDRYNGAPHVVPVMGEYASKIAITTRRTHVLLYGNIPHF